MTQKMNKSMNSESYKLDIKQEKIQMLTYKQSENSQTVSHIRLKI